MVCCYTYGRFYLEIHYDVALKTVSHLASRRTRLRIEGVRGVPPELGGSPPTNRTLFK
jgi:hypothetical protein